MKKHIIIVLQLICFGAIAQNTNFNHGFFCNDWQKKQFTKPDYAAPNNQVIDKEDFIIRIDTSRIINKVCENVFGINSTSYTGNYTTDTALIKHVSKLNPSLVRFPGGDASNMYFFNGLPNDLPSKALTYNGEWTDFTDGSAKVNWKLNTDTYYAFRDSVKAGGIITVNYPYARYGTSNDPVAKAASLAADWVRFDKGRTKYWEVGNETYACWEGGFRIDTTQNKDNQPEYISGKLYGKHFRVFADSMRAAAKQLGVEIFIGAVFADDDYVWDGSEKEITKNWNQLLAPELRKKDGNCYADFISVHSYFLNKNEKTPSEIINSNVVVEELQSYIYKKLDEAKVNHVPLALTEWNIKEPYQTSQVGALQAVATICKMQTTGFGAASYFALKDYWRSDKGDFGMFSNQDPQLPNSSTYPSFYHFYYLKNTLGDQIIQNSIEPVNDSILCYTSKYSDGTISMVIINKAFKEKKVKIIAKNVLNKGHYYWHELSKYDDGNLWSEKISINGHSNNSLKKGGPYNYHKIAPFSNKFENAIHINLKGLSAIYLIINN